MTPVIVDRAVYRHGVREPCGDLSDELDRLRQTPDGFLWIGLKDPTDAEFSHVQAELALHPLAVEDAVKGNQRSKLEVYDDSVFVVMRPLHYTDSTSQVDAGELMGFVGQHFVGTGAPRDAERRHSGTTRGPKTSEARSVTRVRTPGW